MKVAVFSISRVSVFRLFRNLVQFLASEFEKKFSILSCMNQGTIRIFHGGMVKTEHIWPFGGFQIWLRYFVFFLLLIHFNHVWMCV